MVRLAVRLDDARYRVAAVSTDGTGISKLDALAAMNGDFYSQDGGSSGRLVIDGRELAAGDGREPNLGLDDGRAVDRPGPPGLPGRRLGQADPDRGRAWRCPGCGRAA